MRILSRAAAQNGHPARPQGGGRAVRFLIPSLKGSGRGCPLLRASNEHSFTVRVLRARRAPGRSLSPFQPPLKEAFADFCREWTLIAGIVVGGHGEEIGLAIWKIGDGIARDCSYSER